MIHFFLFLFLISSPLYADIPSFSLFLIPEEQNLQNQAETKVWESNRLHLQAILYSDNHNWSFWVNGLHVTSQSVPDYIQVKKVTQDEVQLVWLRGGGESFVTLRVNEPANIENNSENE